MEVGNRIIEENVAARKQKAGHTISDECSCGDRAIIVNINGGPFHRRPTITENTRRNLKDSYLRHIVSNAAGCSDVNGDVGSRATEGQLNDRLYDNRCYGYDVANCRITSCPVQHTNEVTEWDGCSEDSHRVQFEECAECEEEEDDEKVYRQCQHLRYQHQHHHHHHHQPHYRHVKYECWDENRSADDNYSISVQSSSTSCEHLNWERYDEAGTPDGGYGWVIVFVSFMVNLIADGITFSFGVIYREFLIYFGQGKSKTAWIGSLFLAIPLLSGPIASYLTDRYGCRRVSIAGGILAAAGFVISAFINSMELLFFTFGILSGFGLSLCYVAAIVIIAYYFEKRRSLATGLSVCGTGVGTIIFPPFIDYLIENWGWRGTTLILAGLFLNLCVCGALMRDLTYRRKEDVKNKNKNKEKNNKKNKRQKKERKSSNNSTRPGCGTIRTNTASSVNLSSVYSRHHTPSIPSTEEVKRLLQAAASKENTIEEYESINPNTVSLMKEREDRIFNSLISLPTFVRNKEKVPLEVLEGLSTIKHLYAVLVHNYPSLLISSRSISDSGYINDRQHRNPYSTNITPQCSAQIISNHIPFVLDSKLCMLGSKDIVTDEEEKSPDEKILVDTNSKNDSVTLKKPEKRRSILKKKSESLKKGLAAVSNTNSAWWTKRYDTDYGNEIPPFPTAYHRDLKVHRNSLTYRGAMLNIGRYKLRTSSCYDIDRNSMTTIAEEEDDWYTGMSDLWHAVSSMMVISHFRNVNFLLFAISNFLLYLWCDVPYVYLPDYAVEQGYTKDDSESSNASPLIISVIGILNMLGEIIFGWAGDRSWPSSKFIYAVSIGLCGLFAALIPLVRDYEQLRAVAGGFGLFLAANYSLTSIILVEFISLEKFTNAYGLLLLVQGIANLVGPPLAGWLYEVSGNFDITFYLTGFCITLSGGLMEITEIVDAIKGSFAHSKNKESNGILDCVTSQE